MLGRDSYNARTRLWTRGSQTIVAFVHAAKRRRRVLLVATLVIALVVAITGYGVVRYARAQASARVVEAHGALWRCLLGDPLAQGERASTRVRAIQLDALTLADLTRAPEKGPHWPDRCAKYAHQLHEGLDGVALDDWPAGQKLHASSEALAAALEKQEAYGLDLSELVDKASADSAEAAIQSVPPADVPAAPAPAKVANLGALASAALSSKPVDLGRLRTEPAPGQTQYLLVDDPKVDRAPFVCTVDRTELSCRTLPKTVAEAGGGAVRLLGSAEGGAAPLVFAGKAGETGVFTSDSGQRLIAATSLGGHVAPNAPARILTLEGDRLALVAVDGGKPRSSAVSLPAGVDVDEPRRDALLAWGHALVVGVQKGQPRLLAAGLGPSGVGGFEELGKTAARGPKFRPPPGSAPHIDGCHRGTTLAVRAEIDTETLLAFAQGGRWTPAASIAGLGGRLSCREGEATLTRVAQAQGDAVLTTEIVQHRCKPAGCARAAITLKQLLAGEHGLAPTGNVEAIDLDGKLLIVWRAGQRGGLRMRLGTIAQIAAAKDVIVLDDLVDGGAVQASSTLLDLRLLPGDGYALLVLSTKDGLRALRITPEGQAAPIAVAWK